MRLLHTADWHLGARLVDRDRAAEQAAFLDWLVERLREERIDALLLSGDVFDTANPPQDAVALYFDFLKRLADLKTVRAIITGGNHDSASQLNAPRSLLRRFDVHVLGHAGDAHVVDLGGCVVAAVPYLRERDLRQSSSGETASSVQEQVRAAIRAHYATQLHACRAMAQGRPVIAMGHLTVLNASPSDSERDIHIGNLGAISADVFDGFDYTALGHLHRPQALGYAGRVRYSGSPIPLSFSEVSDTKSVVILDTQDMQAHTLPVPPTRSLVRVSLDGNCLATGLEGVPTGAWAEVTVKLTAPEADLDRRVRETAGGRFEVLKVLADLPAMATSPWQPSSAALQDLQPREVFHELLREKQMQDAELTDVFDDLLALWEERQTR
jgi:exonuclease SbcD